jgi:xylulokinase
VSTPPARGDVVLGVDIGSTTVKVVALDTTGRVVARVHRATPRPAGDPTIDAEYLFDLVEQMAIQACGRHFAATAACVAGVGEDGILVDDAMQPLAGALAWFDSRRGELFHALQPLLEPATGLGTATDAARTLVGWLWARSQPGSDRAAAWLALTDFVSCRWSRTAFLSDTLAARTGAWHPATRTWHTGRIQVTLGSAELLPPVLRTGQVVGELRSPRLREAGVLAPEAIVIAGGHDHPVGGWGVHQLYPGAILDSMGTAEVVVAQTPAPPGPAAPAIDISPGIHNSAGATVLRVEELARNMQWACEDPAVADALKRMISGDMAPDGYLLSPAFVPGAAGGLPPRYDTHAPTDPVSRASAVLGAMAELGGRAIADVQALARPGAPICTAGGWARSRGWIEAKQTVTGMTARIIAEPEVTAVGAALLAARALGWNTDVTTALAPQEAPAVAATPHVIGR